MKQYLPEHLRLPPVFGGVRVAYHLVFYVVFCVLLFVCLSFSLWPKCCQFIFDLWVGIFVWYLSLLFWKKVCVFYNVYQLFPVLYSLFFMYYSSASCSRLVFYCFLFLYKCICVSLCGVKLILFIYNYLFIVLLFTITHLFQSKKPHYVWHFQNVIFYLNFIYVFGH